MPRTFSLGRVAYYAWFWPLAQLRASRAAGGPWQQWRTAAGRNAMRKAAECLPPPSHLSTGSALEVHLLSGRRFWEQTLFCLWSFARTSARRLQPTIYDDGSLREIDRLRIARVFPETRFVSPAETLTRLDAELPATRFPYLRERWLRYPNIRKLLDVHVGGHGWKLVLDSDLLFFRRPGFLLEWLDSPIQPLHAVDIETAYGYSRSLLAELTEPPIAERVNVGLCGLRSESIDWSRLEQCCRTLIELEGTHYYLEQALVALLVAGQNCAVAPAADYVTCPRLPEVEACHAVMHHYVADSKPWYFRHGWRVAMR